MAKNIEDFQKAFGLTVRDIRKEKKLTQSELSVKLGLKDGDSFVSKIELGKKDIQLSTVFTLANVLEIHPKQLLDFDI